MRKTVVNITIFASYTILTILSVIAFTLLRPFNYVDNDNSHIVCSNNHQIFDSGPNFIYTINNKLDAFNDAKARKLCRYIIIYDYNNVYETPKEKNYNFVPVYLTESSWPNAIFISLVIFFAGAWMIETLLGKVKLKLIIILALAAGALFYLVFSNNYVNQVYCRRKIDTKVYYYRQSVRKYSAAETYENSDIASLVSALYKSCQNK